MLVFFDGVLQQVLQCIEQKGIWIIHPQGGNIKS